ncbi:MAG: hypothetical protein STSR0007_12330 [Thermovirga sp.]
MGWSDTHLHEFVIKDKHYLDMLESEEREDYAKESLLRLNSLVDRKLTDFPYVYDFDDNWKRKIKVEKTDFDEDGEWGNLYCIEGFGNCPSDDIGGIPGFEEFCEAVSDKKHPEYEVMKDWYGDDFERDFFSRDEVNMGLLFFLRWSKDRMPSPGMNNRMPLHNPQRSFPFHCHALTCNVYSHTFSAHVILLTSSNPILSGLICQMDETLSSSGEKNYSPRLKVFMLSSAANSFIA